MRVFFVGVEVMPKVKEARKFSSGSSVSLVKEKLTIQARVKIHGS